MTEFVKNFKSYISKIPYAPAQGMFGCVDVYSPKQCGDAANYVEMGVLSVFDNGKDGKKSKFSNDNAIEKSELNSVTKKEYDESIKELKAYYKKETGKNLEYHVPSYNELQNLMTYKDLCSKKITPSQLMEPIKPDGAIGQTNQESSGECYQDSSDIALSYNHHGQRLLHKSISINANGYDVTLFGAKKNGKMHPVTYHFTKSQLKNAQEQTVNMTHIDANGKKETLRNQKKYASGDADVVLLDMAIEKYRKESGYKLRPQDKKENKGYDDYLSGGYFCDNIALITGHKSVEITYKTRGSKGNILTRSSIRRSSDSQYTNRPIYDKKMTQERDLLLLSSSPNLVAGCTFLYPDDKNDCKAFAKYDLHEAHQYAIREVNPKKRIVYISNPWYGRDYVEAVPFDDFFKFVSMISYKTSPKNALSAFSTKAQYVQKFGVVK